MALEARGNTVLRYALSCREDELVDKGDLAEKVKTRHVLRQPLSDILAALARIVIRHPLGMVKALGASLRIGFQSDRGLARHLAYLIEAAVIVDWCSRDQVEHLHVHFGTNPATIALLANLIAGISYSLTVHGPEEFDGPKSIALAEKIRAAAFVVAVSSYGQSQLKRWVDLDQWAKLHVVHCGLDCNSYPEQQVDGIPEPSFVCVARLAEQKGHFLLLEATAKLRADGLRFKLVLAGDGPLRKQIQKRIEELELSDIVKITGWISGDRVKGEIAQSRVFVLPSFAEGLPVVLMEAMAMQRPVVSTYVAGIPELVVPGSTGWLVPAGDALLLAKAMREALSTEPQTWAHMGAAARRRVLERHDVNREVEKIERLIYSTTKREALC
ncbi:glycosyltransferase [Microvirga sp.]|uniref:glycosyltransferase n=1 Tax=Microvirga sp. TaxID=1873136 RepID=UPI001FEE602F|nr:glycosyltransferase [Microvirga sp.]